MSQQSTAQNSTAQRFAGLTKILAAVVAVLLVGSILLAISQRDGRKYLTADFAQTNSLYKGSAVKILGVPVGTVESLEPKGDSVRVKISYSGDIKLPNDVKAVVVSPAIVGDRFVQLAPAYSGGAVLKDDAFLSLDRTRVPVELDTIYQSLDDLSVALGPRGANADGALSDLISSTAGQLDGQGEQLNETIRNFGKLSTTLSNNSDDLFGSMTEVNDFVSVLKQNDATVRSFNASTAELSTVLDGERKDLGEALRLLSLALVDVSDLVKQNRSGLRENITNLRDLTQLLNENKEGLREVTVAAPTALANVALAYNPKQGSLDTRTNLLELITGSLSDPTAALCGLLGQAPGTPLCDLLGGILPNPSGAAGAKVQAPQVGGLDSILGGQ